MEQLALGDLDAAAGAVDERLERDREPGDLVLADGLAEARIGQLGPPIGTTMSF